MNSNSVYINKIKTANPPYECHQLTKEYLNYFFPPDTDMGVLLAKVFAKLGIEKRYTVLKQAFNFTDKELGFYSGENFPSTEDRMKVYAENVLPLSSLALEPLLVGEDRKTITHLIITSCTGFYAPGLDIEIIQKFGLNKNVERTLIGFMGCYAAVPALKQAFHTVRSNPEARVLMVNAELCSLHFRTNAPLDQQISFLLFADGCAASLISSKPQGVRLDSFYSAVMPETLDLMRWNISDEGFYMTLDERIPSSLKECIQQEEKNILKGISPQDFTSWAVHPGGRAILDAVQNELKLAADSLQFSRHVLKNYGNMSSPTIMFVLKEIMKSQNTKGQGCGMAFGPGLSLESFLYTI